LQSLEAIRKRREASIWTSIHPFFAIGQLGVFMVSLVLLGLYFLHVVSFATVHLSVLIKIAFMIGAIVTGSLWERDVFGTWWFAQEFFVEDVMTANVFGLHILYLIAYYALPSNRGASLALLGLAYLIYGLNVGQYILSHVRFTRSNTARRGHGKEAAA
jgi:3-vinyl bacteriochlorophyllide hydratase